MDVDRGATRREGVDDFRRVVGAVVVDDQARDGSEVIDSGERFEGVDDAPAAVGVQTAKTIGRIVEVGHAAATGAVEGRSTGAGRPRQSAVRDERRPAVTSGGFNDRRGLVGVGFEQALISRVACSVLAGDAAVVGVTVQTWRGRGLRAKCDVEVRLEPVEPCSV